MRHTMRLPDPYENNDPRTLIALDHIPDFEGDHSWVGPLAVIVEKGRIPLQPSGWSAKVDLRGPAGVVLLLSAMDQRLEKGGTLHHLLPEELQNAPALVIPGRTNPKTEGIVH